MEMTWTLWIVSFLLLFTKARVLAIPYLLVSPVFLLMYEPLKNVEWYEFVSFMIVIDYLCARFYLKRLNKASKYLAFLLLSGIAIHFLMGVDLFFNLNLVYGNYSEYIQALNVLQIAVLLMGGLSARMVNNKFLVDYPDNNNRGFALERARLKE